MVIKVPDGGGCCIGIRKFQETKSFRSARLFIVDQTEVVHLADAAEDIDDLLLAHTCNNNQSWPRPLAAVAHTVWYISNEDNPSALLWRHYCQAGESKTLSEVESFCRGEACYALALGDSSGDLSWLRYTAVRRVR